MVMVWWLLCFVSASGLSCNLSVRPGEGFKKAASVFGGVLLGKHSARYLSCAERVCVLEQT